MTACRTNLWVLAAFTLATAAGGLALSAVARPWVDLPWWKIARRGMSVSAVATLLVFMWRVHGQSLRSLGLGPWRGAGKRHVLQGLALGSAGIVGIGLVYLATGVCRLDVHHDSLRVVRTLSVFLGGAALVAVIEELIFRGYVLQRLLACSRRLALAGSSLAYALVHLKPQLVWPATALELVGLTILGWVLALCTLKTQQLYLAIGLHASLAYVARVNKLLVTFPDASLAWLVGTNRLVNGVVPWLVLVGIGWVISRSDLRSLRRADANAS